MDELLKIAQSVATAVASAMATQSWDLVRGKFANWLSRGDRHDTSAEAIKLDEHNRAVEADNTVRSHVEYYLSSVILEALANDAGRVRDLEFLLTEIRSVAMAPREQKAVLDNRHGTINNGGTFIVSLTGNVVQNSPPPVDHYSRGLSLLRGGSYAEAAAHLRARIGEPEVEPKMHYYLALALLGAAPPRNHRDVSEIQRHLGTASSLPQARLLHLLVDEDHHSRWERGSAPRSTVLALVNQLQPEDAQEIVSQFRAANSQTWQALERRAHQAWSNQ